MYVLHIDASVGNGRASISMLITGSTIMERTELVETTSTRDAEALAIQEGLKMLPEGSFVRVQTDQQYLVQLFKHGGWEKQSSYHSLKETAAKYAVDWRWVKRRSTPEAVYVDNQCGIMVRTGKVMNEASRMFKPSEVPDHVHLYASASVSQSKDASFCVLIHGSSRIELCRDTARGKSAYEAELDAIIYGLQNVPEGSFVNIHTSLKKIKTDFQSSDFKRFMKEFADGRFKNDSASFRHLVRLLGKYKVRWTWDQISPEISICKKKSKEQVKKNMKMRQTVRDRKHTCYEV